MRLETLEKGIRTVIVTSHRCLLTLLMRGRPQLLIAPEKRGRASEYRDLKPQTGESRYCGASEQRWFKMRIHQVKFIAYRLVQLSL